MSPGGADSWIEVQVELSAGAAEILAVEVGELCGGVELRDSDTMLSTAPGRSAVVALVEAEQLAEVLRLVDEVLATARAGGAEVDPVTIRQRPAHEDEWRDVWKQFFRTTRVGQRFVVRPSWEPPATGAGDQVIELDPGRAFGTGAHPSTRLVIAAVEALAEQGHPVQSFLDLGCGSGILAIAASRLWPAARGLAVDNDAEAVACTGENLGRNGVSTVQTQTGTLEELDRAGDRAPGFDLVMANIQLNVLVGLASQLGAVLAPGGRLILSGLLLEDAAAARAAYQAASFQVLAEREEGEWASLTLAWPGPGGQGPERQG